MRIAYLDCFAGIAGDMMLGALVDVGVPVSVLEEATAALGIGASLTVERVDRSGISCTKVHVLVGSVLAETPRAGHVHPHGEGEESHHEAGWMGAKEHGRSLTEIKRLIAAAPLAELVKRTAVRVFELLGASEAKIHSVPVEEIHFHEVGAVDAIVDIVASSAGLHHLNVSRWYCSALNVGGGMVQCAHGFLPVPAPATADLLRGVPTYSAHVQKELVTPTGAALIRALEPGFGPQPAMQVERIGYGAGTRNPAGFSNVLRISVGDAADDAAKAGLETVTVLETALDDASPQVLAYVAEKALSLGALDVMLTPVVMKKGRPGTLVTVLCGAGESQPLAELLLRETTTLGLRVREERRVTLARRQVAVETAYGEIRVKVGWEGGVERNVAPEFEDCRAAAESYGVPLKQVQQAALAAYLGSR